jgi:catecholate siderophore receptor
MTSQLGRIDRMISWRTGIVYKPVEIGSIYAAYGTAFSPAAEGLALSTAITNAANFSLDPEETRTYEVGTKWDVMNERLSLNAAVFRTEKTNARTEDPANPTDILALDGKQHIDGLEFGAVGKLTDKWHLTGAYTFMVSEITKANNPFLVGEELGNTPKNTVSVWTTYELPLNFETGAGLQFVDDRLNNNGSSRVAPQYVTADAMLAYKVNKDVTVRLNAYNVGDVEYIDRVGGGHFIPGAGRSATLTSEFKF